MVKKRDIFRRNHSAKIKYYITILGILLAALMDIVRWSLYFRLIHLHNKAKYQLFTLSLIRRENKKRASNAGTVQDLKRYLRRYFLGLLSHLFHDLI